MLSRSKECWRQVTVFFLFHPQSSRIRTEDAWPLPQRRSMSLPRRRCCIVLRMSQRHAFVAYNCSHRALFRFSPPCPSLAFLCHRGCSWRTPGCPGIFSDCLFICPRRLSVLVDAAGQRTHPVECRRENSIACDIRSVCGLDYGNPVYINGTLFI